MLPPRAAEALEFIENYIVEHGHSPSFRQIGKGIEVASTSGVSRIIDLLVERKFIKRTTPDPIKPRIRAIEVIKPQYRLDPRYARGFKDGATASESLKG